MPFIDSFKREAQKSFANTTNPLPTNPEDSSTSVPAKSVSSANAASSVLSTIDSTTSSPVESLSQSHEVSSTTVQKSSSGPASSSTEFAVNISDKAVSRWGNDTTKRYVNKDTSRKVIKAAKFLKRLDSLANGESDEGD